MYVLQYPFGTAVSELSGDTVMTETQMHRIKVFGVDRRLVRIFGSKGSGLGMYEYPRGICMCGSTRVAIADSGNARVQVVNIDNGKTEKIISGGVLKNPWDVAFGNNKFYVADRGTNSIVIFDIHGDTLTTIRDGPDGEEIFDGLCRIEFHSHTKRIHISDLHNSRMHEISLDDKYSKSRSVKDSECPW